MSVERGSVGTIHQFRKDGQPAPTNQPLNVAVEVQKLRKSDLELLKMGNITKADMGFSRLCMAITAAHEQGDMVAKETISKIRWAFASVAINKFSTEEIAQRFREECPRFAAYLPTPSHDVKRTVILSYLNMQAPALERGVRIGGLTFSEEEAELLQLSLARSFIPFKPNYGSTTYVPFTPLDQEAIALSRFHPEQMHSLALDRANMLETAPIQQGTIVQFPTPKQGDIEG